MSSEWAKCASKVVKFAGFQQVSIAEDHFSQRSLLEGTKMAEAYKVHSIKKEDLSMEAECLLSMKSTDSYKLVFEVNLSETRIEIYVTSYANLRST